MTMNSPAPKKSSEANYAQVKARVRPEIAAAFRAKCIADGVSVSAEIIRFMSGRAGAGAPRKPGSDGVATRRQRRETVKALMLRIEAVLEAERAYMSNIPENLQNSRVYDTAEQTIEDLEDALNSLEMAY